MSINNHFTLDLLLFLWRGLPEHLYLLKAGE